MWLTVLAIVLLVIVLMPDCRQGFKSKPTPAQVSDYTNQLIKHQDDLIPGNVHTLREKLPWIDAITYEDARHLKRINGFNPENIKKLFI